MNVQRIVRIALMGAILPVIQTALSAIPGLELTSFLIVEFALLFQKDAKWACLVYVMIEGLMFGFGLWWWTYLFVWPLFAILSAKLGKFFQDKWLYWAIYLGAFGLIFGALFALPYLFIDPSYALSYWLSGIPWDLGHCVCNFVVALLLGKPLQKALLHIVKR